MTDQTPNIPSKTNTSPPDTEVVLALPRRPVVLGLGLATLVGFGFAVGMLVTQRFNSDNPATGKREASEIVLPQPVTFVPPTLELQDRTGRFPVSPDDDPATGPVDAPVVVIEFSDYQCQFCGKFARETLHPLLELYPDQIRFVYRDLVIYGPISFQAALSAECASEQGAFWFYHDRLFEQQNNLTAEFFFVMAEELDLDMQQFARCVSDPASEQEVKADTEAGLELGIRGTPTFYINGRILVGAQPLDAFAAIIDEELAAGGSQMSGSTLQDKPNDP